MSAMLSGLQANVVRRTLNYQAPIVILPPEQVARPLRDEAGRHAVQVQPRAQSLRSIDQWQHIRDKVGRMAEVVAITPIVAGPGFALRGDASKSITITGIEPETYYRVISLDEKIVLGHRALGPLDIIIGTELANDLGSAIGDRVRVATAAGTTATLTVTGIFDFGNKGVNERNVYLSLRSAQNLLDLVGGASALEVKVRDPFAAETVAEAIRAGTNQQVDSWIKTNAQFFTAMTAQILTNTLIRVFVGLTVALGIASVLVVSVIQKQTEIGILRAMGASRGQILRMFLLQGGAMALAGSLVGCTLGWLFLIIWRSVAKNPDGTPMFIVQIEPALFAAAAVAATVVGVLAAATPARRAARLDPAVAIRS
jgi:lipoprotein-releasing system permease protein